MFNRGRWFDRERTEKVTPGVDGATTAAPVVIVVDPRRKRVWMHGALFGKESQSVEERETDGEHPVR